MEHLTEKVCMALDELQSRRKSLLQATKTTLSAGDNAIFGLDLVIYGVVKKSLSTTHAICLLVQNKNLTCARAILRSHLETAIRFSAFWLVRNPHDTASKFLKGVPLKHFKSTSGDSLTDAYLAKNLSKNENFPWVYEVYKRSCNYVHFGERPFMDSITPVDDNGRFAVEMNDTDDSFPEESWIEIPLCAADCLSIIELHLEGYGKQKTAVSNKSIQSR